MLVTPPPAKREEGDPLPFWGALEEAPMCWGVTNVAELNVIGIS